MKSLHLAHGFSLPLDTVTQSLAILAKRRAGKSYTARRFTEELAKAKLQTVIVDPKGDWWGIRSAADGKSPGLPITILGGAHGDLPLEVGSGEVVAKLVVFECVSVLLDLSQFRKNEVARFMSDFLEAFYRLKAAEEYRSPVMLVVDEADAIAPQKPFKGEERMLGAIEDIVRRGGQRGIGCLLISQRSAVLNKNVLTQVQVLVTMRTIAPQDLDAMNAWIDVHGTAEQRKVLMGSLPSLPIGDAWFWSPGWPTEEGIFKRVHVFPIETFDSGATPKPGERRIEPKHLAEVDLEALRRQMAETIERAQATDPKKLQARLKGMHEALAHAYQFAGTCGAGAEVLDNYSAALQGLPRPHPFKAVTAPPKQSAPSKELSSDRLNVEFNKGVHAERRRIAGEMNPLLAEVGKRLNKILPIAITVKSADFTYEKLIGAEALSAISIAAEMLAKTAPLPEIALAAAASTSVLAVGLRAVPGTARALPQKSPRSAPSPKTDSGSQTLGPGERAILTAAAQHTSGVTREQLSILAGYKRSSRDTYLQRLSSRGLVESDGARIFATEAGIAELGSDFEALPTGDALREHWLNRLTGGERTLLELICAQGGNPISRESLDEAAGFKRSSRDTYLQRLAARKLIVPIGKGQVQAAEELFG